MVGATTWGGGKVSMLGKVCSLMREEVIEIAKGYCAV